MENGSDFLDENSVGVVLSRNCFMLTLEFSLRRRLVRVRYSPSDHIAANNRENLWRGQRSIEWHNNAYF
jgi:hypothetical protein